MKTVIAISILMLSLKSFAQAPEQTVEAIRKLAFLEGVWRGKGWIQAGDKKQYFNETETVRIKVGETLVQIDVYGVSAENDSVIINNGLAIISYNQPTKKYEMKFFQADGSLTDATVRIIHKNTIEINLSRKTGYTRFVIEANESQWFEQGFSSSDGKSWKQVFEMKLTRQ